MAIATTGVAAAPDAVEPQHKLVAAEAQLAQAFWIAEKPAEAVPHDRAGIAVAMRLIAREPDNMAWQREIDELRLGLGDALRKTGDLPGALVAYGESRSASEALAAARPNEAQWRHRRVVSLLRIASVNGLAGDAAAQWAALQAATETAEALVAGEPGAPQWREDLIDVRQSVALVELARKESPPPSRISARRLRSPTRWWPRIPARRAGASRRPSH